MSFEAFAASHGLIIRNLVSEKWVRVPTEDHPHKRNGAYIFQGDSGAVQNWAVHEKPIPWRDENYIVDYDALERKRKAHKQEIQKRQATAAKKAGWIMHQCKKGTHPYLAKKGFPNEPAWVWNDLLVIPMRINNSLVGCQMITAEGQKKFLTGQRTKGAGAVFDNKGAEILCEGYATALSIRRALKSVKTRYKITVCFSAGNILELAKSRPEAVLVADTDAMGLSVAKRTGLAYWQSDVVGEDFNDAEVRIGSRSAGEWLLDVFGVGVLNVNGSA